MGLKRGIPGEQFIAAIAAELGCATTQVDARDADALQRAVAAAGAGDGLVVAFGGLSRRGEDRLRQLRAIEQAFGQRVVEDAAGLLVFLETAAGEVTADDRFDGQPKVANGASEFMQEVFGEDGPQVTSTKGITGHALGAAGAIEAVAVILAMQKGLIPPTSGYATPDPEMPATNIVAGEPAPWTPGISMSNSFGFGGHNGSLVIGPA